MSELRIRLPDDFHIHLRQGPALSAYTVRAAAHFGRILVMPNTVPPVADGETLTRYHNEIQAILDANAAYPCQALMTFKLLPGIRATTVLECMAAGAIAGKYYPSGATTNAHDGIVDPEQISEALATMEELGLVLSIHGEDPAAPALNREAAFLPTVDRLIQRYPRLRIVLEHLSGKEAVQAVQAWPEHVAGTITSHHLAYTIDELLGDRLNAAYFCKPLLKTASDRAALIKAACSASPKFFFGSDSAPHPLAAKSAFSAAAGCYTTPVALALLARTFEEANALDKLEHFTSSAGAAFYGLPANEGQLLLQKKAWTVPGETDGAVSPEAGRLLDWQAVRL